MNFQYWRDNLYKIKQGKNCDKFQEQMTNYLKIKDFTNFIICDSQPCVICHWRSALCYYNQGVYMCYGCMTNAKILTEFSANSWYFDNCGDLDIWVKNKTFTRYTLKLLATDNPDCIVCDQDKMDLLTFIRGRNIICRKPEKHQKYKLVQINHYWIKYRRILLSILCFNLVADVKNLIISQLVQSSYHH